ncbi:MAG: class I SAM-dependent methyltransferase, partial [Pseudomonadota bacterium]
GLAAFNPESKISARLIDRDPDAEVGADWFARRFDHALGMRQATFDTPFYRLIHAEGDGVPGLIIDRFADALVIQPNAAWLDLRLADLCAAAKDVTGATTVVVNATSRTRKLEGLGEYTEIVSGSLKGPIEVPMNGARYMADLVGGQKTGLFFDQRPNHAFAAGLVKGGRVLDLFCHVGGFGLAALANGAAEVLAVDSSAAALELAAAGAAAMDVTDRFATRKGDAFAVLQDLGAERFEMVVSDPPAFAPNKGALTAGLRAYERLARLAAARVTDGGWLVLCSCSHAADPAAFLTASARGIRAAGRTAQLVHSGRAGPDHPQHPFLPENSYLKSLFFRLDV